MLEKERLNSYSLKRVGEYQNLDIHGTKVCTPYFMNNIERFWTALMKQAGVKGKLIANVRKSFGSKSVPYGWYRGKGTPGQISEATLAISEAVGLSLKNAGKGAILEFMKLYGLGVDCSGFTYNTLSYAFSKVGRKEAFDSNLDYLDREKVGASRAGVFSFAGSASSEINFRKLHPLDLILIRSRKEGRYVHIALVLENTDRLLVAQSAITSSPAGVRTDGLRVGQKGIEFEFKPEIGLSWEELYKKGALEFRRLNILE